MPPYSAAVDNHDFAASEHEMFALTSIKNDSLDVSPPPPALCNSPSTDSQDSAFDKFLDASNFCKAPTNPFKTRKCYECGRDCSKFQGYKKEYCQEVVGTPTTKSLFDEDESMMKENRCTSKSGGKNKKIYYHKWCYQMKQYRDEHKRNSGFSSVMKELLGYFARIEREKKIRAMIAAQERQRKLDEEEEAKRMRAEVLDENSVKSMKKGVSGMFKSSRKMIGSSGKSTKKLTSSLRSSVKSLSLSKKNKNNDVIWDEYTDPTTGKKYYYDGVTTTWEKPKTGRIRKE